MSDERGAPTIKVGKILKWLGFAMAGIFGLIIFFGMWFTVEEGEMVVYQNPVFETVEAYTTPGAHIAMPMLSSQSEWNKVATVSFSETPSEGASWASGPVTVRFPDNYTGTVQAQFRFELPANEEELIRLQRDFRGYHSLVDKLLARTVEDALLMAATLHTSESFFQGGIPQYKADVLDFVNNGTPVLEKRQVEIHRAALEAEGEKVAAEDGDAPKEGISEGTARQRQFVEVFVPVMDTKTGQVKRTETPLHDYGIRVTQITMSEPKPAEDLAIVLATAKGIFAELREIRARQANERQAIITVRLKGEREREEAGQRETLAKEVAETQAAREASVQTIDAKRDRNVAAENKGRELEQAVANLKIQEAAALAAKAEGRKIREVGLAKAAVEKAGWDARDNDQYRAKLQADMMTAVSANFKDATIQMPTVVMGNGNGENTNSAGVFMDLLSAAAAHQLSGDLGKSTSLIYPNQPSNPSGVSEISDDGLAVVQGN